MLNSMKTVIIKKDECVRNLNHQVASATYNARPFPMQFCLIYYRGYSPPKSHLRQPSMLSTKTLGFQWSYSKEEPNPDFKELLVSTLQQPDSKGDTKTSGEQF